jgi:hypothetical protein
MRKNVRKAETRPWSPRHHGGVAEGSPWLSALLFLLINSVLVFVFASFSLSFFD